MQCSNQAGGEHFEDRAPTIATTPTRCAIEVAILGLYRRVVRTKAIGLIKLEERAEYSVGGDLKYRAISRVEAAASRDTIKIAIVPHHQSGASICAILAGEAVQNGKRAIR